MQMKLELIPLPVSDVDRAIAFYADKLGFTKDFDVQPSEGVRVVQLTPEGSGCSIGFGTGLDVYAGEPGSVRGVHLVVEDIDEARAELVRRGVEVGEIHDFGGGVRGADFADPDGNTFELQEMAWRKGTDVLGAVVAPEDGRVRPGRTPGPCGTRSRVRRLSGHDSGLRERGRQVPHQSSGAVRLRPRRAAGHGRARSSSTSPPRPPSTPPARAATAGCSWLRGSRTATRRTA